MSAVIPAHSACTTRWTRARYSWMLSAASPLISWSAHTFEDYFVDTSAFPASLHYVALGHLHRAQPLAGACPVWYCGSPLQLDFGETQDDKAVLVVDAEPGRPVTVEQVRLTSGRRLRTLTGTVDQLRELARDVGDDHLRLIIEGDAPAGVAAELRADIPGAVEVLRKVAPELVFADRPDTTVMTPYEQFERYLIETNADDPRVRDLFRELYEEGDETDAA